MRKKENQSGIKKKRKKTNQALRKKENQSGIEKKKRKPIRHFEKKNNQALKIGMVYLKITTGKMRMRIQHILNHTSNATSDRNFNIIYTLLKLFKGILRVLPLITIQIHS